MKKKICFLLVLSLLLQGIVAQPINVQAASNLGVEYKFTRIDNKIPTEVTEYVKWHYFDLIKTTCIFDKNNHINVPTKCSLGKPFVIYDLDGDNNAVYYYPVIENQEIVLVISAIQTTSGINISASDEYVDGLNKANYIDNSDYIFYESNDIVNGKNVSNNIELTETGKCRNKKMNSFKNKKYKECIDEISHNLSHFNIIDIGKRILDSKTEAILEKYTPGFSSDTVVGNKGGRTCKLFKPQPQGPYGLCWAASVATIVNYRKGYSITAKNVADKMNIGYSGGAGIDTKKAALSKYGLRYKKSNFQLGFGTIRANIDHKYPIAMTNTSGKEGHATTLYGYNVTTSGKYIVMHNSGNKRTVTLLYKSSGTTFTYNNKTWTWTKSLSYE